MPENQSPGNRQPENQSPGNRQPENRQPGNRQPENRQVRRRVEVRLPTELAQRLTIAATLLDRQTSSIVEEALTPWLDAALPELPTLQPVAFPVDEIVSERLRLKSA